MKPQSIPTHLTQDFSAKIVGGKLIPTYPADLRAFLAKCGEGTTVSLQVSERKPRRTERQNRAIHLFFTQLADALNEAGYSVQKILSKKMDIDWNPDYVKELLWRPAQKAIVHKKSTTELRRGEEIDLIYDHLVRHLGEEFTLEVPEFPHYENGEYERITSNV